MPLCGNAQAGNWPARRKRASGMHQDQFPQTKDISMPKRLHPVEFVALMAMTMATVAFSIDSMLPALTEIGRELAGGDAKDAQLVLSSFMVGMGVGTLFTGPLSDSFGRKTVILFGAFVYIAGALIAWQAPTLQWLVIGRVLQGLGASAPRVVAIAIIRDLYAGREMARLISFVFIVFTVFPAMAPMIGDWIITAGGWRSIFLAYFLFSIVGSTWLMARLPEPLPRERRQKFRVVALWHALQEMFGIPMVRLSLLVQTAIFSVMFTSISMIEPTFAHIFDLGDAFPVWFFGIGLFCATSSMVNAALVVRFGMRLIITTTQAIFLLLSLALLAAHMVLPHTPGYSPYFFAYLVWQGAAMFQMGLSMGNLNALAMEPIGHIAGLAASVLGAISTIVAAVISTLVAQAFNGTILPQLLTTIVLCSIAMPMLLRMRRLERKRDV
ncbi:Bicyclomycin resistance protein [Pseudooceanicola marinus]|uniref:Bicyclomycin resistance protein n=2 Tax=Pseudooceanicola marinus TaxID=396013 RepID=A0A1X7A865_9RHOB|nr:Bicyclomycin resistance protein [Pseudooceanicola marinus]